jgi:hypothetical protein
MLEFEKAYREKYEGEPALQYDAQGARERIHSVWPYLKMAKVLLARARLLGSHAFCRAVHGRERRRRRG